MKTINIIVPTFCDAENIKNFYKLIVDIGIGRKIICIFKKRVKQ